MTVTTPEVIDWFLNRAKAASQTSTPPTPDSRDFRGVCTVADLHEILTKYSNSKLMPSAEDIKSPNDYWTFLEPLFSVALASNMIPQNFPLPDFVSETKSVLSSRQAYPAYHWQWAVEDAVDLSHLPSEEADSIRAHVLGQLPRDVAVVPSNFPIISDELKKSLSALDEINKSISADFLAKLRKWVSAIEGSEPLIRKKNSEILFLAHFCESVLLQQIEREQFLDSIEEVHEDGDDLAVIVDDAERVRCYRISEQEIVSVLTERDSTVGASQIESVQFSYPFNGSNCLESMPQIGPFCHVCRRRKPDDDMPKCTNKISPMDLVKTTCHRRFCNDCLTMYNWPKPVPNTLWKCPICTKLCTCDRCVRNVFIRSLRNFVSATKGSVDSAQAPAVTFPYTSNAYDIWRIVSSDSQFGPHISQSAPESPTGIPTSEFVSAQTASQRSTIRRQSSGPGTISEETGGKRRRSTVEEKGKSK